MLPDLEILRLIAAGCESVEVRDAIVQLNRLPKGLAAHYLAPEGALTRLRCPSGVRLRFRTGSRELWIGLSFGAAARPFYQGNISVNGGPDHAFGPTHATPSWEGAITLPTQGNESVVEIWLPHLVVNSLARLELETGCYFEPIAAPPVKWLALGDSITQGMTTALPTESHVIRTARALNLDVRNFGIGGAKLTRELAEATIDWPYDILTVAYGTNDFNNGIPPEIYAENADLLLSRQEKAHPHAKLVLITVIPWVGAASRNAAGFGLDDYRNALGEVGKQHPSCHILNGPSLIPEDAGLFVDGVHPNADGMAVYAENLTEVLTCLLRQSSGDVS